MRTRILLAIGAVLSLAIAGGGAAIAAEDGVQAQNHQRRQHAQHLTLYSIETAFTWAGAEGTVLHDDEAEDAFFIPSVGDRYLLVDTLYADEERTEEVGRNDIVCTVTETRGDWPDPETFDPETDELPEDLFAANVCHGVVTLEGQGTLAWQGSFTLTSEVLAAPPDPTQPFIKVAITGGTDAFQRAGGQVDLFDETVYEGEEPPEDVLNRYEVTLFHFRPQHPRAGS